MKKVLFTIALFCFAVSASIGQTSLTKGNWRGWLQRADGKQIVFSFTLQYSHNQPQLSIINSPEKLQVKALRITSDSISFSMPVFESAFKAKIINADSLQGEWTKGSSSKNTVLPFFASTREPARFQPVKGKAAHMLNGKYTVKFSGFRGNAGEPAIAVFKQDGSHLTGSILTPTGDYRYLDGLVTGDSLLLSTFDGVHAFLITATVKDNHQLTDGKFYSGAVVHEEWTAYKNDTATLPDLAAMYLKNKEEDKPAFSFTDIDGKQVNLSDARFKDKVVILQLMGSWCPNCMDETAFLSEWYKKNHQRGVEIIGLAYEYSTDFQRSQNSLRKFQQRFQVDYPLLITGVTVSDTLRTEKTLPLFTHIKTFPTSIILDKNGRVRKIDTGFFGPGTGDYYTHYKQEFEATISELLKEQKDITKS
ncbi:peroxiredoxin family protein [Deminuibacter soli]|uniref:TlpA family protein disulfide reductase n=1 Tax=Deminuibacter soli TaxID=2291815 RepID=A0A3E1NM54_9BACT|nr:TlpA disulfide reductase family protein [Deminuibacter soli]RFM28977.1 TlpA family protein disulfide reductase [Deminuibacter soli]